MRQLWVERVVDSLVMVTPNELDLVLHPGSFGQLQHEVPQVRAPEPPKRQPVGQPEDPLHQVNLVSLATEQEGAASTLHDRHLVTRQEPVDGCSVERLAVLQPVDREPAGDARSRGAHVADQALDATICADDTRLVGKATVRGQVDARPVVEHHAHRRCQPRCQHGHPGDVVDPQPPARMWQENCSRDQPKTLVVAPRRGPVPGVRGR